MTTRASLILGVVHFICMSYIKFEECVSLLCSLLKELEMQHIFQHVVLPWSIWSQKASFSFLVGEVQSSDTGCSLGMPTLAHLVCQVGFCCFYEMKNISPLHFYLICFYFLLDYFFWILRFYRVLGGTNLIDKV